MPTEGVLRLNGQDGWRVTIAGLRAGGGVGLARLTVELELRARSEAFVARPVWLGAVLRVHSPGLAHSYLCDLTAAVEPSSVPELAAAATVSLQGSLSLQQLKLVEAGRSGGVELELELRGYALTDAGHVPFWMVLLDHTVEQSRWIDYLGLWGYRNVLLLEIDHPGAAATPQLGQASRYLREAQDHLLRHNARPTVESLRQSLVALIGDTTAPDNTEQDVETALRAASREARDRSASPVGYDRRLELVRLALKFATDLAAHPEEAETTTVDAEALFVMTAGLLQRFGKQP